jgi:hypothetical protein
MGQTRGMEARKEGREKGRVGGREKGREIKERDERNKTVYSY